MPITSKLIRKESFSCPTMLLKFRFNQNVYCLFNQSGQTIRNILHVGVDSSKSTDANTPSYICDCPGGVVKWFLPTWKVSGCEIESRKALPRVVDWKRNEYDVKGCKRANFSSVFGGQKTFKNRSINPCSFQIIRVLRKPVTFRFSAFYASHRELYDRVRQRRLLRLLRRWRRKFHGNNFLT
jgi:hypothetical protein